MQVFRVSYCSFSVAINDVREIVPLIKRRQADYSYLLCMLRNLIDVIGENYPDNVQLARMFKTLINNKSELAKSIDADEAEVERVLSKMLANVDEVYATIKNEGSERKLTR